MAHKIILATTVSLWAVASTLMTLATFGSAPPMPRFAWAVYLAMGATVQSVYLIVEFAIRRALEVHESDLARAVGRAVGGELDNREGRPLRSVR